MLHQRETELKAITFYLCILILVTLFLSTKSWDDTPVWMLALLFIPVSAYLFLTSCRTGARAQAAANLISRVSRL